MQKLAAGRLDGYQYEDMPDDRETWRLVLEGLDATAQQWHGKASFADCAEQDQRGNRRRRSPPGSLAGAAWERVNVSHAWEVCTRMALGGVLLPSVGVE